MKALKASTFIVEDMIFEQFLQSDTVSYSAGQQCFAGGKKKTWISSSSVQDLVQACQNDPQQNWLLSRKTFFPVTSEVCHGKYRKNKNRRGYSKPYHHWRKNSNNSSSSYSNLPLLHRQFHSETNLRLFR